MDVGSTERFMFVIRSIDTKVILSVDEMQYENTNTEGFWRILRELVAEGSRKVGFASSYET
jgi:hypothetical protein